MEENGEKRKLTEKYDVVLMAVSVGIIVLLVAVLTAFPEQGREVAAEVKKLLTYTFGSFMEVLALGGLVFLLILGFSKYGKIKFGEGTPDFSTISWIAMMFFTGLGAGTVYWAFLEWGYHYNAAPQIGGVELGEAYRYELSLAYSMFDWGPSAWALLCLFALPFCYHYHVKKDRELRFSALCKYAVGEKMVNGLFGKIVDFLFIFAAVGSICITAGVAATTIASVVADLAGIKNSFPLTAAVLVGIAVLYSISSLLGVERGMRKISDWNVFFCIAFLLFILFAGPTRFILDSLVNSLGLMVSEYVRMSLWLDPVNASGYPQEWTVFYFVYWFVFGPFTGLFIARISKGRTIKEIILNMLISGTGGLFVFFGIIGAYGQYLKINNILDIPAMIVSGQSEQVAEAVIHTLPMSRILMLLYLLVIVLFLATTLDSCSFTLCATVSRKLKGHEEPKKGLKFAWCIILIALPLAISYTGTDIDTIKSIVLVTGLPLVVIMAIIYYGFLKEMRQDYGNLTGAEIEARSCAKDAGESESEF